MTARVPCSSSCARGIRYIARRRIPSWAMLASAWAAGGAAEKRPEKPLPPDMAAALRAFREQRLLDWVDESIPALGGRTPRQAALEPAARRRLETLLKEMEQGFSDARGLDQRAQHRRASLPRRFGVPNIGSGSLRPRPPLAPDRAPGNQSDLPEARTHAPPP